MDPVAAGEDGRMWECFKSGRGSGHVAHDGLWSLVIELRGGMIPLRLIERRNGRNYRRPTAARGSPCARARYIDYLGMYFQSSPSVIRGSLLPTSGFLTNLSTWCTTGTMSQLGLPASSTSPYPAGWYDAHADIRDSN